MDKPAHVILQLDKSDLNYGFWFGIIDLADKKTTHQVGNVIVVMIRVKSYSMVDHQFIQIKADFEKGKEVQVWIPRNLVMGILETKTDLSAAFSFVGKTTK